MKIWSLSYGETPNAGLPRPIGKSEGECCHLQAKGIWRTGGLLPTWIHTLLPASSSRHACCPRQLSPHSSTAHRGPILVVLFSIAVGQASYRASPLLWCMRLDAFAQSIHRIISMLFYITCVLHQCAFIIGGLAIHMITFPYCPDTIYGKESGLLSGYFPDNSVVADSFIHHFPSMCCLVRRVCVPIGAHASIQIPLSSM